MPTQGQLLNYIGGEWRKSSAGEYLDVINPATAEVMGQVPLSPAAEVREAAEVAAEAFVEWRQVPVVDRVKYSFGL
jgi:malonate-semialdehyde dehydrogenase (acetylating)/methylmalonate-semialdehyde dehydrogenase